MTQAFRPQRGRLVATVVAIAAVVIFGLVSWRMPGPDVGGDWRLGDRLMLLGLGVAIALLLLHYARIAAWPEPEGLRVRNLFLTRVVPWAQIEGIRYGGGEPWVTLELTDGDSLAVMAIQRADGERGRAEAQRLAELATANGGLIEP